MFQGFIEWTIASRTTGALNSLPGVNNILVVFATGLLFGVLHAIKKSSENFDSFYKDSASTLQGISAIMFTNSVVFWVIQTLAPSSQSNGNIGLVAVALAVGIILAKTITTLMLLKNVH